MFEDAALHQTARMVGGDLSLHQKHSNQPVPQRKTPQSEDPTTKTVDPANFIDYAYNNVLGNADGDVSPVGSPSGNFTFGDKGRPLAAVIQPSLTVMVTESIGSSSIIWDEGCVMLRTCAAVNVGIKAVVGNTGGIFPFAAPSEARHLGGNCFAFVDGHVKWYKANGAADLRNPESGTTAGITAGALAIYHFRSSAVFSSTTPFSTSGGSPTFNAVIP